jgi:hypothetical protein
MAIKYLPTNKSQGLLAFITKFFQTFKGELNTKGPQTLPTTKEGILLNSFYELVVP